MLGDAGVGSVRRHESGAAGCALARFGDRPLAFVHIWCHRFTSAARGLRRCIRCSWGCNHMCTKMRNTPRLGGRGVRFALDSRVIGAIALHRYAPLDLACPFSGSRVDTGSQPPECFVVVRGVRDR